MPESNGTSALSLVRAERDLATWDTEQKLTLLRQTYAKGLNQDEFELFIEHARQIGLNPLTKQIQPIKFDGKTLSFHTTIHGLVAIADRTGRYAGVDDIEYDCEPKGESLGSQHPTWAKATVYKITQGVRCAYTAKVRWLERNRGQASWKVQPWHMLGKCCLAAAFRLAFEETRGLYIEEELPGQIVDTAPAKASTQPQPPAPDGYAGMSTTAIAQDCAARRRAIGIKEDEYKAIVVGATGKEKHLVRADWLSVAAVLDEMENERAKGDEASVEDTSESTDQSS